MDIYIFMVFCYAKTSGSSASTILGNPGVTHSVPTAFIAMNAVGTEWVTPVSYHKIWCNVTKFSPDIRDLPLVSDH